MKKKLETKVSRRTFLKGAVAGATLLGPGIPYIARKTAAAQTKTVKEVKIACVFPMSGPYSRNGNLFMQSTKAAIGWVNDNGGIKSLGGAKLVPVFGDAGGTVEGSATAMERVLKDPEIRVAQDGWSSSFNMASTEITERAGIPQFNVGFSDALHERGFKWGFYVVIPATRQAAIGLQFLTELAKTKFGIDIKTAMLVGDNSAVSKIYFSSAKTLLPKHNIQILGEETWTAGTLTDATAVMQKVRTVYPDIVLYGATAISECQMCLMKRKEFGINIPFVGMGAWGMDPSFRTIGAEALEGLTAFTGNFPNKLTPKEWVTRSMEQCKKEYSNEPFIAQELGWAWATIPIIALVLEQAGSVNNNAIRETALKMDVHDSIYTRYFPKQGIAFAPTGRIAEKYQGLQIAQWRNGVSLVVYPDNLAMEKPVWVYKKK